MSEVASAYVTLMPSAKGFGKRTESLMNAEMGGTGGPGEKQGKGIGKRMAGGMGSVLKGGLVGIAASAGALAGTALFKGFSRLQGLESAQSKLTGLGHSAKTVDGIMKNALASVKGTAFGLDEAATVAANAVAAGVKPGRDLERTLKLVADASTIAGTDMGSMGAIFNKVAASNKVQMDVVNQLHDQGVPALALLAKQMGVTAEEAQKMASEGKVDFATFQKAMESGLGGAAQESGKTLEGAYKNTVAALGRIGANLLSGIYPQIRGFFTGAIDLLGKFEGPALKVGENIGKGLADGVRWAGKFAQTVAGIFKGGGGGGLQSFITALRANLVPVLKTAATTFQTIILPALLKLGTYLYTSLAPVFIQIAGIIKSQVLPILMSLGQFLYGTVYPALVRVATAVAKALKPVFDQLVSTFRSDVLPTLRIVLAKFREWQPTIQKVIGVMVQIIGKWYEFQAAVIGKVLPPLIRFVGFVIRNVVPAIVNWIGIQAKIIGKVIEFGVMVVRQVVKVAQFVSSIKSKFGEALTYVKGIPGKIGGYFKNFGTMLYQAGVDLIQGLINGAGSLLGDIGRFFLDKLPGWIRGPFEKAMGIASPSKVFRTFGGYITAGLVKGLEGGQKGVNAQIGKIAKGIDRAFKAGDISKSMAKSMKSTLSTVDKWMTKLAKRYETAWKKLNSLTAKHAEMAGGVRDSLRGELDLGSLVVEPDQHGFGGGVTFSAISGAVAGLASKAAKFAKLIEKMLKAGIPRGLVQEVAGLGLDKGITVANALLSGSKTQVKTLRSNWSAMATNTQVAGNALANGFYATGIQAQAGLIKGLLKSNTLERAAKTLASKLTKAVRKQLGIRSPSRVMAAQVGVPMAQGVGVGYVDGLSEIQRKVNAGTRSLVTSPKFGELLTGHSSTAASAQLGPLEVMALLQRLLEAITLKITVGMDPRTKAQWLIEGQKQLEALA